MPTSGWLVKRDGVCSLCGIPLKTGEVAVYERLTKTIRCVVCPATAGVDLRDFEAVQPDIDLGTAGGSARREYERRKATREQRVKGKVGDRLGRVVLAFTDDPQSTRAWRTGARGEEALARTLQVVEGLHVLHDRRVPGTAGNIDHIVISPAGVFVVDAKQWQGRIEIRNRGNFFRPDRRLFIGRRDGSDLAIGLAWQVEAVTTALTAAGVDPVPSITPVLCFVDGDWPLIAPPDSYAGVRLESPKPLREIASAQGVLDPSAVEGLTRALALALPSR